MGVTENSSGEVSHIDSWWMPGEGSAEMMVENVLKMEEKCEVLAVGKSTEGIFPGCDKYSWSSVHH